MKKTIDYSTKQIADAKNLFTLLEQVSEKDRHIAVIAANAFMFGMKTAESLYSSTERLELSHK